MTKDENVKDWRSTGRKRARAILVKLTLEGEREYVCENCGLVPEKGIEESARTGGLDCQHKNKDIRDSDPANLKWLCRTCHYAEDRATAKGISTVEEDYGYSL